MTTLLHSFIANQAKSRAERSSCGVDEFFDKVVLKCSLCRDVCEAKIRAGLQCLECKGYKLQTNGSVDRMDNQVIIILPLVLLAFASILAISAIIFMAVKLHKQKSRINRGKLLETDSLDVEAKASNGSHSNEINVKEIYQDDHPQVHVIRAKDNIYLRTIKSHFPVTQDQSDLFLN